MSITLSICKVSPRAVDDSCVAPRNQADIIFQWNIFLIILFKCLLLISTHNNFVEKKPKHFLDNDMSGNKTIMLVQRGLHILGTISVQQQNCANDDVVVVVVVFVGVVTACRGL